MYRGFPNPQFLLVATLTWKSAIQQIWKLLRRNLFRDRNRVKAILECGDMSPLFFRATCRPVPKRGHVRALQIKPSRNSSILYNGQSLFSPEQPALRFYGRLLGRLRILYECALMNSDDTYSVVG